MTRCEWPPFTFFHHRYHGTANCSTDNTLHQILSLSWILPWSCPTNAEYKSMISEFHIFGAHKSHTSKSQGRLGWISAQSFQSSTPSERLKMHFDLDPVGCQGKPPSAWNLCGFTQILWHYVRCQMRYCCFFGKVTTLLHVSMSVCIPALWQAPMYVCV